MGACTPSTRGGQTPGPTRTGRSCTRVAGRSSVPSPWTPSGRRSTRSGPRGLLRGCPSGSERGLARRPETQRPQRVRRLRRLPLLRRRRSKLASHVAKQLATSAPKNIPDWVLLQTFLGIFRCSKDKMAVHFYLKTLLDHSLSPVRNKINISLGMEANTQRFCYNRRNLS